MGFGAPGSPPDRSRYFDIQSRQLNPNSQEWTELVPGATPYDMLEFRKFDDPYFRGDRSNETVDQYYTAAVKQSDDSKYNIYDPDTGDVTGYDEQAYFADLYNIGDEFGQGYFIDREEKEYTDSGDFAGYNYFLAQQEGYEALAPDYSAYDPQPEPEPDPQPTPPTPKPQPQPDTGDSNEPSNTQPDQSGDGEPDDSGSGGDNADISDSGSVPTDSNSGADSDSSTGDDTASGNGGSGSDENASDSDDVHNGSAGNASGNDSSISDHHSDFGGAMQPWELPEPSEGGEAGLSPVDIKRMQETVATKIKESQKAVGDLGAEMVREIVATLDAPKVRWQNLLRAHLRKAVAFTRGHGGKRYRSRSLFQGCVSKRVVLKSKVKPIPSIAIVVDTSGSMGDDDLQICLRESQGIIRTLGNNKVTFYTCDSRTSTPHECKDVRKVIMQGGGGTDMRVGIRGALEQSKVKPDIIVVLTDGGTRWPREPTPGTTIIAGIVGKWGENRTPAWLPSVDIKD